MRDIPHSVPLFKGYHEASETTATAAAPPSSSNPPEFVVEELRDKLRAAEVRERELHQHLLFHMQEKESLVKKVAELQRVCEALVMTQIQESNGSATALAKAGEKASFAPMRACAGHGAPVDPTTTSNESSMGSSSPIANGNNGDAIGGITGPAGTNPPAAAPAVVGAGAAAGAGPSIDIPQLLFERGGCIRITALWEAYQARFGKTQHTLKDLFSMVKAGAIPYVVHEPPAGIRLLPSAPVFQQQQQHLQQLVQREQQRQQQQQLQQRQAAGPPACVGGVLNGVGRPQQQPPTSASGTALQGGVDESGRVGGARNGADTSGENITFGWVNSESPSASERSQPGSAAGGGNADAESPKDHSSEASAKANGRASVSEVDEQGDGEHQVRFGSFEADSPDDGATTSNGVGTKDPPGGSGGGSGEAQKRRVNWKELNRHLNLLLKEEGGMDGRELNRAYQIKFGESLYLEGGSLRQAVTAGWLKGVCYDLSNKEYNLVVRIPVGRRQEPPDGAPAHPPASDPTPRSTRRDAPERPPSNNDVDWERLSSEFRQILLDGALEPHEVHAKYHREFKKPFSLAGYSMRQAVIDGLLGGIAIERSSRRLMCAR